MDALLTDEQNDLRLAAASLARDVGTAAVSELADGDPGRAWTLLSQSGFLGLRAPEDLGSPQASGVDVAVVTEQLAITWSGRRSWAAACSRRSWRGWREQPTSSPRSAAGTGRLTVCLSRDLTGLASVTSEPAIAFDAVGLRRGTCAARP